MPCAKGPSVVVIVVVVIVVVVVAVVAAAAATVVVGTIIERIQVKSNFFSNGVGKGMCSAQLVGLGCPGSQLVPN